MSKEYAPFTPSFDVIAKEVGTIGALTFGVIWRHCQMRNGLCYASKATLSELTEISRSTIKRYLAELVEHGLIIDTTPGEKFRPHAYKVSPKAKELLKASGSNHAEGGSNHAEGGSEKSATWFTVNHEETIKILKGDYEYYKNSKKLLNFIATYHELRYHFMQHYSRKYLDISEIDAALTVMFEDIAYRVSVGETLTDAVLFDDAIFEDSMLSAGLLGVDSSYLTSLFQQEVIVGEG